MAKYLDYTGLTTVWQRIKAYIAGRISSSNDIVTITNIDNSVTGITKQTYQIPTTKKLSDTIEALDAKVYAGSNGQTDTTAASAEDTYDSDDDSEVKILITETDGKITSVSIGTNGLASDSEVIKTITGDTFVSATKNNNTVTLATQTEDMAASAGSIGTYNSTTGEQTTAPTAPTLTGNSSKLTDTDDIATKVKTYVDGKVNIEKARSDANTIAKIAALDSNVTLGTDNVTQPSGSSLTRSSSVTVLQGVKVGEVDGKLADVGNGTNSSNSYTLDVDAAGAANAAYLELLGDSSDDSSENTIYGVKAYADAAVASAFGGVTSITYNTDYSSYSSLPTTGEAGVIYLIPSYGYTRVLPAGTENPSNLGWYEYNSQNRIYTATTDTTVNASKTYYTQDSEERNVKDEYIYIPGVEGATGSYEKLGEASLDLDNYLKISEALTTQEIERATS